MVIFRNVKKCQAYRYEKDNATTLVVSSKRNNLWKALCETENII